MPGFRGARVLRTGSAIPRFRGTRMLRAGMLNRELGADDGFEAGGSGGAIELRRPVHAVAVEERERGIPQLGRALDERRRLGRAVEKRKGR